jgi:hypothetical protein
MEISNLEVVETPQQLFDGFNSFILSQDTKVFNKLIARTLLYESVKNIPGDIVECGVFKGTGLYTFLKLKRLLNPNTSKKVIGFDFYDTEELITSINIPTDKDAMKTLFEQRNFAHERCFEQTLREKIIQDGFFNYEFELVKGDISVTTNEYVKNNPGFKVSLLYMDVDLEIPTYNALVNLWGNITKGGMIVFDEYGYHKWSESKGVDRFISEYDLQIQALDYTCPTAYIKKYV